MTGPSLAEVAGWKKAAGLHHANKPDGTLYVGVTSELARRVHEHRKHAVDGFTKRYNLERLVYAERHDSIDQAIQRESRVKKCPRAWKIDLIRFQNPEWRDLYETLI